MSRLPNARVLLACVSIGLGGSLAAQPVCSSDGQLQPLALLERFMTADCEACWLDPTTPLPKKTELVLDWIVPGSKGDDAPLAMGALPEGLDRLADLKRAAPAQSVAVRTQRLMSPLRLRVAQGEPFNDYIGVSIELEPARLGPFRAWLLLVEVLPRGAGGSPVPRNLVRNVFRPPWAQPLPRQAPAKLYESRPMQIHEGATTERLRVVALVEDSRGRLQAVAHSECPR